MGARKRALWLGKEAMEESERGIGSCFEAKVLRIESSLEGSRNCVENRVM